LTSDVILVHPDVMFGVIEPSVVTAPNVANVTFASEQGAFLAGAAAALKSETGVVGYLGGLHFAPLERFRAGFEAGARHVDPDVEVVATYLEEPFAGAVGFFLNPFTRPDLGRERGAVLYERADVVFHAASMSGFGLFDAAVEQSDRQGRHLWAIGVDNDQWLQATPRQRDHLLTSMIKRADLAAFLLTRQFVDGELIGGSHQELDLADDVMDFSTRGNDLTTAMIGRLRQLKADIIARRVKVPTEPTGELLVLDRLPDGFDKAFADLSPDQIMRYFDGWLLPTYPGPTQQACAEGTMRTCGQHMMDHLDEWRATAGHGSQDAGW
jgi:basic membrane protein A